mmetsp:Transcript_25780/g.25067  ORF Transcript_25780/g.25067 Transcript_25780/m.25067 type:complete len:110 (-) Transcript_25780:72-401(-)
MYENGLGIERDAKSAFYYYKKAADLNHGKALKQCGDFYYTGRGNNEQADLDKAFKCYMEAAKLNNSEAMNNVGLMLEMGGILGNKYHQGMYMDLSLAKQWYEQAVEFGN